MHLVLCFGLRHMLRSMVKLLICLEDAWWYVVVQEANAARSGDPLVFGLLGYDVLVTPSC